MSQASLLWRSCLLLAFLTTILLIGILLIFNEGAYQVKAQINKFFRRLKLTWKELKERFTNLPMRRLSDFLVLAVFLFVMVGMTGGFDTSGWLFSLLVDVAQSLAGVYILYWSGRRLNKKRTHELTQDNQVIQGFVHLICIAIIVGCSFS